MKRIRFNPLGVIACVIFAIAFILNIQNSANGRAANFEYTMFMQNGFGSGSGSGCDCDSIKCEGSAIECIRIITPEGADVFWKD